MTRLPLPPRYDIDFNPVPRAEPGCGSFAELESLALAWLDDAPDTLRCHPVVASALQRTVPAPEYPAREYKSLIGIRLVVDAEMPPGAWKLLRGDEQIDAGNVLGAAP